MHTKKITINRPHGLHLRTASEVVNICKKYNAKVSFSCRDCREADGCSILSLLLLGAKQGEALTVNVEGAASQEVIHELEEYFSDGSGI